jgi:hypothetical protein
MPRSSVQFMRATCPTHVIRLNLISLILGKAQYASLQIGITVVQVCSLLGALFMQRILIIFKRWSQLRPWTQSDLPSEALCIIESLFTLPTSMSFLLRGVDGCAEDYKHVCIRFARCYCVVQYQGGPVRGECGCMQLRNMRNGKLF